MIEKIENQIKIYTKLFKKQINLMNEAAITENYEIASDSKNKLIDSYKDMEDLIQSMGYDFTFDFGERITFDDIDRLEKEAIDSIKNTDIDPIKDFVNKLKMGGSIATEKDIEFYTNNKEAIEAEMRKGL